MVKRIEVLASGILATVQDLGRPGQAAIGVGRSGAADRRSFTLANRLVGNPEHAAGIEVTLGGLAVRADSHSTVAVTGAPCPLTVDGTPQPVNAVLHLSPGAELRFGQPAAGLRSYLAVRGGLDVPRELGSASTDMMSGLGPPRLTPGTMLRVGGAATGLPTVDVAPVAGPSADAVTLRVLLGPRDDWFVPDAVESLWRNGFRVSSDSDRVGIRLTGEPLVRRRTDELPSEGMVPGALQVPPSGLPTLFLADHPVTGGYPVIGVVVTADVDLAAQLRPGQVVRFRPAR